MRYEITKLAASRPYTAKKRLTAVLTETRGYVTAAARLMNISVRTLQDLISRLDLRGELARIRAVRSAESRAVVTLAWRLHGRMYERTPEGRKKVAARQARYKARKLARIARGEE